MLYEVITGKIADAPFDFDERRLQDVIARIGQRGVSVKDQFSTHDFILSAIRRRSGRQLLVVPVARGSAELLAVTVFIRRITSYNVCYTKLLRVKSLPFGLEKN